MAAPIGNQNAKQAKRWQQAIFRALSRASNKDIDAGLDKAATKLVEMAFRGDKWAIDHLADRTEGRASQGITLSGDDENPVKVNHRIEFVDGEHTDPSQAEAAL
jgi:hypothetical protein